MAVTAALADDDDVRFPQTQRPQDQDVSVNHKQAIGADEVDGPTIFEGLPALNGVDAWRDALRDRYGVYFHGQYVGDPYADLSGGLRRGATFSGRLDVELDVDARKTLGIPGGTLHTNLYQIHGRDLSRDYIGNFLSTNDIAALPTTRLYELWYEQRFGDKLSVRAGQQGIDVEFVTSSYAANFIDASFGWPGLLSEDLPDGGPAYPLATPAVRVKFAPAENISILGALFDGRPAGPCAGDPQTCDRYGVNFRISDPPLAILEAQIRYNDGGSAASALPGRVKLGAFGHFGRFADQRFGTDATLPAFGGTSILHSPDGGIYGIIDQQVYRLPDDDDDAGNADKDDAKGVGVFARAIGAPPDRNPVDLYVDAGLSALGLVPGRPSDLLGIAGIFAKISSAAVAADQDAIAVTGPAPVRSFEAVLEATYEAQVVPGFTLQPTFQYIVHPGGNVADPYGHGRSAIPDAKVLGMTTTIHF